MKAALIKSVRFFPRVAGSNASVFEMDEPLGPHDILLDVVTGDELVVESRGFLTLSPQLGAAAHWSRRAAIGLRGDCKRFDGRLVFAGDVSRILCLIVSGRISTKSCALPVEIPITGALRLENFDCPSILKVDDHLVAEFVVLTKAGTTISRGTHPFVCVSPAGDLVTIQIDIDSVREAPEVGKILDWHEEDAPVSMR